MVRLLRRPAQPDDTDAAETVLRLAVMLQAVPGCYLWLGSGRSDNDYGLHSQSYDFNDDLLPLGIGLWVAIVRQHLGRA